ncbi:elongator complex protein 2 [Impatiens glandulifera]|uniref:elongator complex protein 2 n=1 Tax=Impatiens glandulifera TaxID=253017 RepID=UPI001FB17BCB|nr:elongator complex protein 2 [Impatiens glandulifera]
MEVERVFIGAGCNRIVNNVSWGASGLVSFGTQNGVAIFCPKTAQILTTLPGHKASVNCTHWLPSNKFSFMATKLKQHYLLSGDANGCIILWELSLPDKNWKYILQLPESHKKGVTCISGIMISQTDAMFASSSSDGTVHVWELIFPSMSGGDCKLSLLQSFSAGTKPMVAVSLAKLPGNNGRIVIALGGLDNKIHLFCGERTGQFVRACELKGHTDWIRSLDFSLPINSNGETNNLLLVSSSQDRGIRIWKMVLQSSSVERSQEFSLTSFIKGPIFKAGSMSYQISLESLLIGHEDWVYSVEWQPPLSVDGIECEQPLSILSASMDKTMMIWQPEKTTGIWMNVVIVGELGHCALGFYGGHWSPNGDSILAHGYGGSFHLWRNVGFDCDNWKPQKVPSGHFAAVSDISWAKSGQYLLSVSHDQTTRVFATWLDELHSTNEGAWHEVARPQVHGHDINCVTIIKGKGNHRFVCGSEEKVARVFEAPLSFLKTLNHACLDKYSSPDDDVQTNLQILGANMSALGLSQKPIYVNATTEISERTTNEGMDTLETIPEAVPVEFTEPPIEEQLVWHTLWPETHKLYGHGNELFSLCSDHVGKIVASSCKAQSASVADIWLWQVGSWKAVGRLQAHSLTVSQMEFSYDDKYLLAVSRDRHFSVFSIEQTTASNEISYGLVAKQEGHKRIIWTCSWNPLGHEFATGSRDKTVKIWGIEENSSSVKLLVALPQFSSSVTALSWASIDNEKRDEGILAVGMENGLIELWRTSISRTENGIGSAKSATSVVALRFDPFVCNVSSVNRLAWRNSEMDMDSRTMELASCGDDHTVRVFRINLL